MAGSVFSGGDKVEKFLTDMADKISKKSTLQVGFFEGSQERDGTSTPMVAAINEFGGTIPARRVEAHEAIIYNKLNKNDDLGAGGKFVKRSKSNFARAVQIPAHEIPEHKVPARPFFRRMISLGQTHWGKDLLKLLKTNNFDSEASLNLLGQSMQEELQDSIGAQVYKPLAASTVARKGFNTTLLEFGDMKNNVGHRVD